MSDNNILSILLRYRELGIDAQIDFEKFYLYSIITHSTAIEGSTVTEVENQLLFDEGILPAGKPLVEQLMNLDLRDAYLKWLKWAKGEMRFTTEILCQISASVMRRTGSVYSTLQGDFDSSRGELRKVNVRAGANGRSYMAFQKVPTKLEEFCLWLNERLATIDADDAEAVYRLSFAAHFRLVTIHPWVDGNGRTTRLLMNILQAHYHVPMSKVHKNDKAEYIQSLIDAREADNESIFIEKMMALHHADLEKQVRDFEEDTSIEDDRKENSDDRKELSERQRRLLAEIAKNDRITINEMTEKIGVSEKTVRRDLEALQSMNALKRVGGRKSGHWEIVSEKDIRQNNDRI